MHVAVVNGGAAASSTWLVLGGIGLAVASNAKPLQMPIQPQALETTEAGVTVEEAKDNHLKEEKREIDTQPEEEPAALTELLTDSAEEKDEEDKLIKDGSPKDRLPKDRLPKNGLPKEDVPKEDAILFEMRVP